MENLSDDDFANEMENLESPLHIVKALQSVQRTSLEREQQCILTDSTSQTSRKSLFTCIRSVSLCFS